MQPCTRRAAGAKLQLPQRWGVWFIAASVALVAVDAPGS
jgi:hypothetical protein